MSAPRPSAVDAGRRRARVLVVDDSDVVGVSLMRRVESVPGFGVAGTSRSRHTTLGAPPEPRAGAMPDVIAIAASTGGPQAVLDLLGDMRQAARSVPILIVQHMPAAFTAVFAEHVHRATGLDAREAVEAEPVLPGRVYVAPGGRHMGLRRAAQGAAIRLDDGPALGFCRPAADVLFRDAALVFGAATLGIVLTGMGQDGTEGARAILDAGGATIAQDRVTSTVWGMPGSLVRNALAGRVLPLRAIGPAIEARMGAPS